MMEGARGVNGLETVRRSDWNPINNYKFIRSAWHTIARGLCAIGWSCDFLLETNCVVAGIPIF